MQTLKKSADFDRVYKAQKRWHHATFALFFNAVDLEAPKAGFVVSKKIGNAVCRNRVKRRLRALYADALPMLKNGEMILMAKAGIDSLKFAELQKNFKYALRRLDLINTAH